MYPKLDNGKASHQETPMDINKTKQCHNKSLLSLATEPGNGQLSKTEDFYTITSLLQVNTTEKPVAPLFLTTS